MSLRQSRWKNRHSPCCCQGSPRCRVPKDTPSCSGWEQSVQRPDANGRGHLLQHQGPTQSPGSQPQPAKWSKSSLSKRRKCEGQPLHHPQAESETHTLCAILQKKTVNGADFWRSGRLPGEIKYRDCLNTGHWTLNWKEAVKTRRHWAI